MKKRPLQNLQCRIISIPKGQMKIARSFNCGLRPERDKAPKGRLDWGNVFSRPFGTRCVRFIIPPLKRRAIVSRHFVTFASIEFWSGLKRLIQLNLLLLLISSATAQETQPQEPSPQQPTKILRVYDWKDLEQQHQLFGGEVISMDGMSVLKIENTNNAPLKVLLLMVTNSSLIQKANTIEWEMKCENVLLSRGYSLPPQMFFTSLENDLWGIRDNFTNYPNVCFFEKFPPQAAGGDNITNYQGDYFNGTQNWDKYYFSLRRAPYDNQTRSDELKLEIFLPSSGTVYLRPIKLLGVTGSWWSEKEAPWIGGIGGPIIGCLGGLLGWLSGKGKARKLVLAVWKACIAAGILFLIVLFIALATGQPEYVSMPLFVFGIVTTTVFGTIFPTAKKRYEDLEIRRMTSVDV